jgi:SAM-dependent methyltransferase
LTDAASAAQFFDAVARRYDRVYAPGRDETARGLARVLRELPAASRVLDLGVGTGRELPALLDAGHLPTGLDASDEMLALCARRSRPVPLVKGDLWERLPWDDGSFDAVLALHGTLSHPPSDEARARLPGEVARVLRPGGVFVAEVPTLAWLDRVARETGTGVERLGDRSARFTDEATGATVLASFLSEAEWRTLFESALTVRIEPAGDFELMIVGHSGGRPSTLANADVAVESRPPHASGG